MTSVLVSTSEVIEDAEAHVSVALQMIRRQVDVETDPDASFALVKALGDLADARARLALARFDISLRQEKESRLAALT